jgi:hypothetical protein
MKALCKYAGLSLSTLLLLCTNAAAGPQMKCTDGSGRVIYTDLSSCADALRAAPPAPKSAQQLNAERSQRLQQKIDQIKTKSMLQQQKIKDQQLREQIDRDYREKQRLIAEDEQRQQECALMRVEADRQWNDANYHGGDSWWRNRAIAYTREMEIKCGHEVRLGQSY